MSDAFVKTLAETVAPELLNEARTRLRTFTKEFEDKYGSKPLYLARAPGRFNLIGEHVDYSEFPVLPQAIDKEIQILFGYVNSDSPNQANVTVQASSSSTYPFQSVEFRWDDLPNLQSGKHESYFKAAVRTVAQDMKSELKEGLKVRLLITSTLPPNAGLSSSAALLVALILGFTYTLSHTTSITPSATEQSIVASAIKSEHAVGVHTGGMDQTISVYGQSCVIEFFPEIHVSPMTFRGGSLVVAHCGVVADKKLTAEVNYNRRVAEVQAASTILSQELSLPPCKTLRQVVEHAYKPNDIPSQIRALESLMKSADEYLGAGEPDVSWAPGALATYGIKDIQSPLKVHQRTSHVLSESVRVLSFRSILQEAQDEGRSLTMDELKKLGTLMNESHKSCKELFECSCDALDELVEVSRKNGALGSRLTGAGWGGFTVSLLPPNLSITEFEKSMKRDYYDQHEDRFKPDAIKTMPVAPNSGASIILMDGLS